MYRDYKANISDNADQKYVVIIIQYFFFSHVILGLEEVIMLEMTVASALAKVNYIS